MKLSIEGIQFNYGSSSVLKNINLTVGSGEILSLAGPNGSGKTTLLRCINRILKPKCGSILVEGNDVCIASLRELALTLGYVPQNATASFPLTVFDTVLLGRKPHVNWRLGDHDKDVAFDVLKLMNLDHLALRLFNELSGGEKQKVLIARAICQEPKVMILDEPTSNLDLRHQLEVLSTISKLVKDRGIAAVMAMHDLNLASRFSHKIAMLKDGIILSAGKPDEVLVPDTIRDVYEVEVLVYHDSGHPFIVPLSPVTESSVI